MVLEYMCLFTFLCVYVCVQGVCVCAYIYIYIYLYICVSVCVCVCVCVQEWCCLTIRRRKIGKRIVAFVGAQHVGEDAIVISKGGRSQTKHHDI